MTVATDSKKLSQEKKKFFFMSHLINFIFEEKKIKKASEIITSIYDRYNSVGE